MIKILHGVQSLLTFFSLYTEFAKNIISYKKLKLDDLNILQRRHLEMEERLNIFIVLLKRTFLKRFENAFKRETCFLCYYCILCIFGGTSELLRVVFRKALVTWRASIRQLQLAVALTLHGGGEACISAMTAAMVWQKGDVLEARGRMRDGKGSLCPHSSTDLLHHWRRPHRVSNYRVSFRMLPSM